MFRYALLAMVLFLVWRAVKPYISGPQLKSGADPEKLPPPKRKLSPDEERIDGKTPYEVLGVKKGDTWESIQDAYKRKIGEYHPDKAEHLAPEVKQLMAERTKQLNKAFEALSKRRSL